MNEMSISVDAANQIYSLLVAWAVATERWRENFVATMNEGCREYRLDGSLGPGGKFYNDYDRWRVGCYPERETESSKEFMRRLNASLADLREESLEVPHG